MRLTSLLTVRCWRRQEWLDHGCGSPDDCGPCMGACTTQACRDACWCPETWVPVRDTPPEHFPLGCSLLSCRRAHAGLQTMHECLRLRFGYVPGWVHVRSLLINHRGVRARGGVRRPGPHGVRHAVPECLRRGARGRLPGLLLRWLPVPRRHVVMPHRPPSLPCAHPFVKEAAATRWDPQHLRCTATCPDSQCVQSACLENRGSGGLVYDDDCCGITGMTGCTDGFVPSWRPQDGCNHAANYPGKTCCTPESSGPPAWCAAHPAKPLAAARR